MYLCLQINSYAYHFDFSWIWNALPIQRMVLELAIMPSPGWEANTVNTAQFALKGSLGDLALYLPLRPTLVMPALG